MMLSGVVLLVLGAAFAWGLTGLFRRYALAASLLDVPNSRSSHSVPTPRGGGVAFILGFLLMLVVGRGLGLVDTVVLWAYLPAGCVVAVVGFLDDRRGIPARWRLLAHFLAGALLLFAIGGLAPVDLPWGVTRLRWVGSILALIYLVWLLNLYNFMDGIDGIASLEAISVCLAGALCAWWVGGASHSLWLPLMLAAAVAGFLIWNFPPARIFMGDAGSGFIGLVLGGLSLQAAWQAPQLLWSWLILLGVFIVDATWTLLHRLLRGERVYEAHRSHAYQRASRRWGQHRIVSLSITAINVIWLTPLSLVVASGLLTGALGLFIAYAPLVFLAVRLGAGAAERPVHH
ncbi:MAG: putative undecaprenyl-phosphate N-acetylglucosaminyl 1-phosphate transferase [Pseudomonas delhiensis]|nr:MAG: putative undecaprenyl-phosphate N-acetylglucosaminyl 1-phosphate transferase [Pseudomonas delhiensis]